MPGGFLYPVITPTEATGAGTIPAGYTNICILNTGAAVATVAGGRLPAGAAVNFNWCGRPYNQIAYDATGTTIQIYAIT